MTNHQSKTHSSYKDILYYLAFFMVEFFAAIEITACIVASPKIAKGIELNPSFASLIMNSYLYSLIIFIFIFLFIYRFIQNKINSKNFFLIGLLFFFLGNMICFFSVTSSIFFIGRIVQGLGAAMAFTGQMWSVSEYYKDRITIPLSLGEIGGAIGVVIGPLLGGIFADLSFQGWRYFFLFNAFMSFICFFIILITLKPLPILLLDKIKVNFFSSLSQKKLFIIFMLSQVAVSLLAVGAEYLFSDFLQIKRGKSALFVGLLTLISSVGIIIGSILVARKNKNFVNFTRLSIVLIIGSLFLLTFLLKIDWIYQTMAPIFLIGLFMGIANVSIYAGAIEGIDKRFFLLTSLIYLIAMQMGNAVGIQITSIYEIYDIDLFLMSFLFLIFPIIVLIIFRKIKNI